MIWLDGLDLPYLCISLCVLWSIFRDMRYLVVDVEKERCLIVFEWGRMNGILMGREDIMLRGGI